MAKSGYYARLCWDDGRVCYGDTVREIRTGRSWIVISTFYTLTGKFVVIEDQGEFKIRALTELELWIEVETDQDRD